MNKSNNNQNKLFKLELLPTKLSESFNQMYALKREFCIDEHMIYTKSRTSFIQHMPKNQKSLISRSGHYVSLSSYYLSFQIYTRKSDKAVEYRLLHHVVFDLLQRFLGKGHHVFFDNCYTSYQLVDDLQQQSN